ncbi:tRNA pseudouridine(38-40) synthase TruA [Pyrococcus yayanosii]|uniref:tRNA pseudouridine synthase A n=1 Tax=Pyrococcus yayanosii (strain CH1 / JCM 16557) TaxID=529709 RepID=F8AHC2_PYRYC|nr:tRNA pseudouridine(38-40) synthase TruA [Pyrococcus yayanosii]AEH24119.1 tRNA pseudouridine synthase A [Pyrococcus yayanosii CH1]
MKVALRIAYDGTQFHGFQRQPSLRTVEGELLRVLEEVGLEPVDFKGASRTDKGVSAFGNVVAFTVPDDAAHLVKPRVLNARLEDVWVLGVAKVPKDFHPRFWAKSKVYRYYLVGWGLNVGAMRECAALFVGEHDFSAFARLDGRDPVRRILRASVEERGPIVVVEIEGESFLWEMVRRIVTAVRLCGEGKLELGDVEAMLRGEFEESRKLPPAPPEGLVLWAVKYEGVEFEVDAYTVELVRKELFERFSAAAVRAAIFEDFLRQLY